MSISTLVVGALLFAAPKPSRPMPVPPPPTAPVAWLAPVGPIPSDFYGDPTALVPTLEGRNGKELGFWEKSPNSSARRDWSEFWWRQLSARRDLAMRGWALFGDPVSLYLQKVKDSVLASQPELRAKIRVYACPSPYVNAMTLPDGLVLFNMGFLARLTEESQVATVIAHEAAHYSLRHAQDAWWENRESWGGDRWSKTRFQHSREREAQADSLGMIYLAASRYNVTSVDSLFGILDGSANAQGTRPWTKQALQEFPDLAWPDSFWIDPALATTSSSSETEDADSMTTHPVIPKRRAAVKRFFGQRPRGGEPWLVGKVDFEEVRRLAKREMARSWLDANQPAAALIESWGLMEAYPADLEIRRVFRQSLIELAMNRGAQRRSAPRARRIRIWGAYQTLDHFLSKVDDARMLALGLLAANEESRLDPADSIASARVDELREEWAISLTRHLEFIRDTSRIARSLRPQRATLELVRRALPNLGRPMERLPAEADTGWRPIEGSTLYLADVIWGDRPLAKSLGGIEAGKRIVRDQLKTDLALSNVRLVAPDPSLWTPDSLASLRSRSAIREWLDDRLDSRGPTRSRPQLSGLRQQLAKSGAGKILVVTIDAGLQESRFDRNLVPLQVSVLGNGTYWPASSIYVSGAIFDSRDGSVVRVARARVWETPSKGVLTESTREMVRRLTAER